MENSFSANSSLSEQNFTQLPSDNQDEFCVEIDSNEMNKKRKSFDPDDKKNRGNYRCGRCNLPKKGHVCPYQLIVRRRDGIDSEQKDISIQVEVDKDMTVAMLGDLKLQGTLDSYKGILPNNSGTSTAISSS